MLVDKHPISPRCTLEPCVEPLPATAANSGAPLFVETLRLDFYEHELVDQAGHICKLAALANLDKYYAARYGVANIPLRKNTLGRYRHDYRNQARIEALGNEFESIRQIAKRHHSLQGEVLCRQDMRDIGSNMGYLSVQFLPADLNEFKQRISTALHGSIPIFICYPMAADRSPSFLYRDNPSNEHAGLIVGYNMSEQTVTLASSGRLWRDIGVARLWRATRALPEQRRCEYYLQAPLASIYETARPKYTIPFFGWGVNGTPNAQIERLRHNHLIHVQNTATTPPRGSGYRGVLILFSPAPEHARWRNPRPA